MKWKTTLALLAATIGIGAYIFFYEQKRPTLEQSQQAAARILSLSQDSVNRIIFEMPQARCILNRQVDWRFEETAIRADQGLLERMFSALNPLVAQRTLSSAADHSLDSKTFGLQPAVGQITFFSSGRSTTIRFGDPTPIREGRYLQVVGRPEIFAVSSRLFEASNQPAQTFRDPLLIRLKNWLMDELTVSTSNATFTLSKKENKWSLTQPFNDRADASKAEALLSELSKITIQRFPDQLNRPQTHQAQGPAPETTEPPMEQPLIPPDPFDNLKATVTFVQRDPERSITVLFGQALSDDPSVVYAKRSDETLLYAVLASSINPLLENPQSLRDTHCFDLEAYEATKVEWAGEGSGQIIERIEGQWQTQTKEVLDPSKVEGIVENFRNLQWSRVVEAQAADLTRYGLNPPVGSISIWKESPDPQRLSVGAPVENTASRYGWIEARSLIVELPENLMGWLDTTVEQLKQTVPTSAASAIENPPSIASPPTAKSPTSNP